MIDDVARARVSRHRRRHDPDGARAGNQHIFAQHREIERGMHRVAERIENAGNFGIDRIACAPRRSSWAGRCIRRMRRGGSRPLRSYGRRDGGGPAGSCGSARRPHGLPRSRSARGKNRTRSMPTATISPMNSWPIAIGTGMVRCAHSSQSRMWISVPQIEAFFTRIRTSLIPISGTGRLRARVRALGDLLFTSAFIT